jgi:phosphatidylserine decarboxylase
MLQIIFMQTTTTNKVFAEPWQKTINDLAALLSARSDLREAMEISIRQADYPDIRSLTAYYQFLNSFLTEIPTKREMGPAATKFHYLISQSPGDILKKDRAFLQWLTGFSQNHGAYLDTTESAGALETFINDPGYHIEDYDAGASGWLTFNQFFARHTKPGKRPVHEICNPSSIVAATDSVYLGNWRIAPDSTIKAKGVTYEITQLLDNSPYQDVFRGGLFTHSWLDTNDYHRFHVPVSGTVKEVRKIPGNVVVKAVKKADGTVETTDETGFQFTQTRGLVIIDSPIGFVALLPVGMGHVSSVNLTVEKGAVLAKGQEFGYFAYGGSDMVMLFQAGRVEFTATVNKHYKQGEKIARGL